MKKLLLIFILGAISSLAQAQAPYALMPTARDCFYDSVGQPLNGGFLWSYAAGTTNPLATYSDSSGLYQNSNPINLDAAGCATVWIGSAPYKFVLTTNLGLQVWMTDNVSDTGQLIKNGGYVDLVSNQSVSGNKSLTGSTTLTTAKVKNLENIVYADQFPGADIGAQVMAAYASLPTHFDASSGVTYPAGVISLEGYAGTNQVLTTPIVINTPFVHLRGPGSGQLTLNWNSAGIGIDISTRGHLPNGSTNASITQAGKYGGFTLKGNGTPGSIALQYGDIVGGELDDIWVEGFTGSGSVGIQFNNQTIWTEQTVIKRVETYNNTIGYLFENTNIGNPPISVSFGYSDFTMHCNNFAGQICMLLTGTVQLYHSNLSLRANVTAAGAGPVLSLTNTAQITDSVLSFLFEGVGTFGVSNLAIDNSNVATLTSTLNPPVGSQVGFKNFTAGYLINGKEGTVLTTSPTSFTASIPGAAFYASAADAGFTGFESIRVDATSGLSGFGYADNNQGNLVPVYLGAPSITGGAFHIGPLVREGQQILDGGYVSSWAGLGTPARLDVYTGVNNLFGFGVASSPTLPVFSPFVTMASSNGNAFTINTLAGSTAENGMIQVGSVDNKGNAVFSGRIQDTPTTFALIGTCNAALEGSVRAVTDSTTVTWGATITGGGSNHVQAYCDQSAWTVSAK